MISFDCMQRDEEAGASSVSDDSGNGDSHMVLPTSGPDDVLGHVLGCQRLEPFVDLFRGLFVPPETGDGEG
jgi:hypothetical protein